MAKTEQRRHTSLLELLIHILMAPTSSGTFSWQPAPDQLSRYASDLRWAILRRIFPELGGKTPYRALLQKHAIRVDSLDKPFLREVLEVVRDRFAKSFSISAARDMSDLELLKTYFIPVVLEWAENERSVSVARERTPSIEDLISHEDSSGNVYQRFPDEFSWAVSRLSPGMEAEAPRELPDEMVELVHRIADQLTRSLGLILESGNLEKYILLMARLEDNICTWEMTFDYLNSLGMKRYSSWKSLSVVANRAMKEFVGGLPSEVKSALHQDDPALSREEKHERLRMAVAAALEISPLPTPMEVLSRAG